MESAYRNATRLLSLVLILLGCTLIGVTVAGGGGPLARGVVIGMLLAGLGAGRLYLARGAPSGRPRT